MSERQEAATVSSSRVSSTPRPTARPTTADMSHTPPTTSTSGPNESIESTPCNQSQQKRKRKGDDVDEAMSAISAATHVFDEILVSHLPQGRRPGPVS